MVSWPGITDMLLAGQTILPIIILIAGLFLLLRLKFFSTRDIGGRYLFLSGLIFLFVSLAWNWVAMSSGYDRWFVQSAYAIVDWIQFGLAVGGLLLITAGLSLYADFWQSRRSDIEAREGRVSVLENLQRDARQPYHLMELLNISIKEILYHSEASAGALFLINRRRRQLVLTSSVGFSKQETAGLEHYPLGRNVINQAVELGEPVIAGKFMLIDPEGKQTETRYDSTMILPLVSGMDKLGAIVLTSTEPEAFARIDISFLMPVSEWLAEKIKSARITRELNLAESKLKTETGRLTDLGNRLREAINAMTGKEAIKSFCTVLVGLADSESVHLYSVSQGQFKILGGSEPLFDLPENYKAALVEALNRNKTLIVNQESTDDDGLTRIVQSSLICPVGSTDSTMALLFRKDNGAFRVDDDLLDLIDLFGKMARLLAGRTASDKMAITRRLGFDRILDLVRMEPVGDEQTAADILVEKMVGALPRGSMAVALNPDKQGAYELSRAGSSRPTSAEPVKLLLAEAPLEQLIKSRQCQFASGKSNVTAFIDQFDSAGKSVLSRQFGEKGRPAFIAACPVGGPRVDPAIGLFAIWDTQAADAGEWERLLTLASGLVSLRLAIDKIQQSGDPQLPKSGDGTNDLNNALSAILGRTELAVSDKNIPDEVREHLRIVMAEAQRAGQLVGQLAQRISSDAASKLQSDNLTVDGIIKTSLAQQRISGNLHMIGGRPREIDISLNGNQIAVPPKSDLGNLFEAAMNRFTVTAAEEDTITISTYVRESSLYLDISRHRKNFPAVRPVAGFSQYTNANEAIRRRPMDIFLKHLRNPRGDYAVDEDSQSPAYLSFKFPISEGALVGTEPRESSGFRILAIDDEAVILDLIQAMCKSQGWQVVTASSGEEGLALIEQSRFDLVLTDLAMPGLTGLDVARRIRMEWPEIPIILVTGWEAELNSAPIKAAGISEILFKPFRIEQLTEVIQATASKT